MVVPNIPTLINDTFYAIVVTTRVDCLSLAFIYSKSEIILGQDSWANEKSQVTFNFQSIRYDIPLPLAVCVCVCDENANCLCETHIQHKHFA